MKARKVMLLIVAMTVSICTFAEETAKPFVETLLSTAPEHIAGNDVLVTRATFPANFSLPKHFHPVEEYAYVLEGEIRLKIDGEIEKVCKSGDFAFIPAQRIHSANTGDAPATLLIYRIQPQGQPIMITVD